MVMTPAPPAQRPRWDGPKRLAHLLLVVVVRLVLEVPMACARCDSRLRPASSPVRCTRWLEGDYATKSSTNSENFWQKNAS
jgi:hypothetical protein